MSITPDTKDWTWVLERPCPECGFEASAHDVSDLPVLLATTAAAWSRVLGRADVADRPRPGVWSALEYGCLQERVMHADAAGLHEYVCVARRALDAGQRRARIVRVYYDASPLGILYVAVLLTEERIWLIKGDRVAALSERA